MHYPDKLGRLAILNAPHPSRFLNGPINVRQLLKSWYIAFFQLPGAPEAMIRANDFWMLRRLFRSDPVNPEAFTPEDIERYVEALARPGALTKRAQLLQGLVAKESSPSCKGSHGDRATSSRHMGREGSLLRRRSGRAGLEMGAQPRDAEISKRKPLGPPGRARSGQPPVDRLSLARARQTLGTRRGQEPVPSFPTAVRLEDSLTQRNEISAHRDRVQHLKGAFYIRKRSNSGCRRVFRSAGAL